MKRGVDVILALILLPLLIWPIVLGWCVATLDTGHNGFFTQHRVGRNGRLFRTVKLRTMRPDPKVATTVSTSSDSRITPIGAWLRRSKLDELPQLFNILAGQMSFVGPRPDVPGFADRLEGADRVVLAVLPGVTGPASLKFRDEEEMLARQEDPERYNREVLFPEKVRLNREYVENYSLLADIRYIWLTATGGRP